MQVSIVVAAAENDVIGAAGDIPWRLPDDQRHFKALTRGHCVVMGRLTYESIGRPLPDRRTIVITARPDYTVEGAEVASSLDAALTKARRAGEEKVFVAGGEQVYARALALADLIHLTRVHTTVPGDTEFPDRETLARAGFSLADAESHPADDRHAHAFTFERWTREAD